MLDIRVVKDRDRTTVVLDGEIDMSTADRVRSAASSALARHPDALVVDLRLVRFIDSCGLRALVDVQREAERRSERLVIVRGPLNVDRVFQITALDRVLNMVDDPASLPPPSAS